MKTFFAAAIVLAGSIAMANQGIRKYNIIGSQVSGEEKLGSAQGSIAVNYDEGTITMQTARKPKCPPNALCAQYIQFEEVTLPIVAMKKNSCGIMVVTASKDQRPVDGLLQTLTVEDASEMTCQPFAKYVEQAVYTIQGYNMLNGKELKRTTTMDLELAPEMARIFQMAEGDLAEGFPGLEIAESGSLKISETEVTMHISIGLNCAIGSPCPMYMPGPIKATLPIVSIKRNACSTEIIARAANFFPYDHKGTTEIRIHDYTYSACEMYYKHPVTVEYFSDMTSNGGQATSIKRANFSFDFAPTYHKN